MEKKTREPGLRFEHRKMVWYQYANGEGKSKRPGVGCCEAWLSPEAQSVSGFVSFG